jgi:hypothetical protein
VIRYAPEKPLDVAKATVEAEALAPAPLEFETPSTASAVRSAFRARSEKLGRGQPGVWVFRSLPRHGEAPFYQYAQPFSR